MTHSSSKSQQTLRAIVLAALGSGLATGCSWQRPHLPSVLVILVEQLGFNSFSCGEEGAEESSGAYALFCSEAVRFTHAYAPSTMSQASIASILTGRYPYQTGVRNNGPQSLAGSYATVSKAAIARGYRTSFFSGGPPIFRKSGFNAGFETFDDASYPTLRSLHRPALDVAKAFLAWRDADASARSSFLSVLYLPDLQFPDAVTANELGEARDLSWASQNAAVNQSLGFLARELKARRAWDDTYVFLAGLNSHEEEERDGEIRPLNLFSDGLRVRLMAKPARKSAGVAAAIEPTLNWKVDANVSLVDLGATLFELIGAKAPACEDAEKNPGPAACGGPAPIVSLKRLFDGSDMEFPSDRAIIAESAWADWHGLGAIRYAIRQGPYLFLGDGRGKVFDAYRDPLETRRLAAKREPEVKVAAMRAQFSDMLSTLRTGPWSPVDPAELETIDLGSELWRPGGLSRANVTHLRTISNKHPNDSRVAGWRASIALRQENWNDLRAIGDKAGRPMWSYVAALNMGLKSVEPDDACLKTFHRFMSKDRPAEAPTLRECASPEALALIAWADDTGGSMQKQKAQEAFLRVYGWSIIDTAVSERNQALRLIWDVSPDSSLAPRAVDLLLALPENRKYRLALNRRLMEVSQAK